MLLPFSATDCPFTDIEPESNDNKPHMFFNNVVLPAPFGPIKPRTSPSLTSRDIPFKTSFFLNDLYINMIKEALEQ